MRLPFAHRTIVLAALGLALAAAAASAEEALYLDWVDCALGPQARHDFTFACNVNLGQQDLYCAFRLPAAVDSVLGVEVVVDVQHANTSLPAWWRFDPGACRWGELAAHFNFGSKTACADFLGNDATGDVQGYYVGEPRGGTNQARIQAAGALTTGAGYRSLDATSTYYAARLTISDANTTLPGVVCSGCAEPACLVLNAVVIRRQPGAAGGDVIVNTPSEGNGNWATWQGGTGANCAAVPVRAVTWGRVKSLYR